MATFSHFKDRINHLAAGHMATELLFMDLIIEHPDKEAVIIDKIVKMGITGNNIFVLFKKLANGSFDLLLHLCKNVDDAILKEACHTQNREILAYYFYEFNRIHGISNQISQA